MKCCYLKEDFCYLFISLHLFFVLCFFVCCCPQLKSSSIQVTVELQGTLESIRASCEQVSISFFFFSFTPSQEDFRMTGAGNKLEANAKDGFLKCNFLWSHDGEQEIKTDLNLLGIKNSNTLSYIFFSIIFFFTESFLKQMCLSSFLNINNYATNTSWGWYSSSASEEGGKRIMDHVTHVNVAHAAPCPTALLL